MTKKPDTIYIYDVNSSKPIDLSISSSLYKGAGSKNNIVVFRYFKNDLKNNRSDYNFIRLCSKGFNDGNLYYFYFKVIKVYRYLAVHHGNNTLNSVYKIVTSYVGMYDSLNRLPFKSNSFDIFDLKCSPESYFSSVEDFYTKMYGENYIEDYDVQKNDYLSLFKNICFKKLLNFPKRLVFISSNLNQRFGECGKSRDSFKMKMISKSFEDFENYQKNKEIEDSRQIIKNVYDCWMCINVIDNNTLISEEEEYTETFIFKNDAIREIYDQYDIGFKKYEIISI